MHKQLCEQHEVYTEYYFSFNYSTTTLFNYLSDMRSILNTTLIFLNSLDNCVFKRSVYRQVIQELLHFTLLDNSDQYYLRLHIDFSWERNNDPSSKILENSSSADETSDSPDVFSAQDKSLLLNENPLPSTMKETIDNTIDFTWHPMFRLDLKRANFWPFKQIWFFKLGISNVK